MFNNLTFFVKYLQNDTVLLENPIQNFISKHNVIIIYLGLAFFGLIVIILTEVFYISSYNFGTPRVQMIGLSIGFALEHIYINFEINPEPRKKWNVILRNLIGIFIISII